MEPDFNSSESTQKRAPFLRRERSGGSSHQSNSSQASHYHEDLLETGNAQRYTRKKNDSKVIYLNGESLSRPLDMPEEVRKGLIAFLISACLIGVAFFAWYFDQTFNEPVRQKQAIAQILSNDVPYDFPQLESLITLKNAEIFKQLESDGLPIYEMPGKEGKPIYDLVKLPQDVNALEAAAWYAAGIAKLDAKNAAKLLNGAWTLQIDRENGVNMVMRYATFKAESVDVAVQTALTEQGLNDTNVGESGTDNAGNTFVVGTIEKDGHTYSWRVSALPLSKMYKINGLPENAVYVGVRMTS